MKTIFLKAVLGATLAAGALPASANLVYVTGTPTTGTGLGAVLTVVTVHDTGNTANGIESGCVTPTAIGASNTPSMACQEGLQGGDNAAINRTYLLSSIAGILNAGQLGFVVNLSEPGNDRQATLSNLYLSLFNTSSETLRTFSYVPDPLNPLVLSETGGVGQSGDHRFIFDAAQASQARLFCPILSECILGGGIQFAAGTTDGGLETMYVGAFRRDDDGTVPPTAIPEPGSLALLGIGTLAFGLIRRRFGNKR